MNTSKKVSWHLAAVTAAALLGSGAAMAAGHGYEGHDRNRVEHGRMDNDRGWREPVHRDFSEHRGRFPERPYWQHEGRDEWQAARWHRHWHDYDRYYGYYAPPLPLLPPPPFIGRFPFGIR